MKNIFASVIGLLALAIVVAGATYSCQISTIAYNELANACITHGGTWMNQQGSSAGTCIAPKAPNNAS